MVEITTKTTKTEVETKPFPKLMKVKDVGIVFFTEPQKGLWIERGSWYETWNMHNYEDYNEPVTLKNK